VGYKRNEKKYIVQTTSSLTIDELIPTILSLYSQMCEYHDKEVVDVSHIKNYMRTMIGISISVADMNFVMEEIVEYRDKKAKETLERLQNQQQKEQQ